MADPISDQVDPQEAVPPKQDDSVAYSTYKRVLDQRKADSSKLKTVEEELNALRAEKASSEEAKLAEQGQFKELLEAEKLKSEELQRSLNDHNSRSIARNKEEALRKELGPLKNDEYLKFADVESISMDADGNIDLESVKQSALKFRDNYPDLLKSESSGLPNNAPSDGPPGLTYQKWLTLSSKEQKARQSEVID